MRQLDTTHIPEPVLTAVRQRLGRKQPVVRAELPSTTEIRDAVLALYAAGEPLDAIPELVGDLVEDLVRGGKGPVGQAIEALDRPVAVLLARLVVGRLRRAEES